MVDDVEDECERSRKNYQKTNDLKRRKLLTNKSNNTIKRVNLFDFFSLNISNIPR